jgi:TolB-like protein
LPDKPSIAVLPFRNLNGDPEEEYFADGMTDDLITDLSRVKGLFVIARNSVFTYKDKSVKIKQVAEELGVRYVLEGSIRRVNEQVRINAQLIDATTGGHLWAERYDGKMDDVFALQDKITRKIVGVLAVKLTAGEEKQVVRKETDSAKAYDAFLKGWAHYRRGTADDFIRAITYFEEAVKEDPNYSRAYAALASIYYGSVRRWFLFRRLGMIYSEALEKARQYLQEAMKNPTPLAHLVASDMHRTEGRHQDAITEARRAIFLDANDPDGYFAMSGALIYAGSPAEGADAIKKAMRLDPHDGPPFYLALIGFAQFGMERFEEAAATLEQAIELKPDVELFYIFLAATYGHLGWEQEAKSTLETLNGLRVKFKLPPLNLQSVPTFMIGEAFKKRTDRERLREGLRKAGVLPGPGYVAGSEDLISRTEEGHYEVEGVTTVDVTTAKELFDRGVLFIDVRRSSVWESGHIRDAVNLIFFTVFTEVELPLIVSKDEDVVIYCGGPT